MSDNQETRGQWIVAVMLDGTLTVDAVGPFRSEKKAEEVERILTDAAIVDEDSFTYARITPQVVRLRTLDDVLEEVSRG